MFTAMQPELLIAILAGLGGMLGWGFSEFATKGSVDKIGTISSLVWAHVIGTVLLFILLFAQLLSTPAAVAFPGDPAEWLGLLFFGALQTAVYYFGYKGFEKGEVSLLSPIFASFAGLVALLSVLVFGETLRLILVPALVLIFGGVILINIDFRNWKARGIRIHTVPGLKEIVIATVLATVWTLGWDTFTGDKNWLVYTTFMFVFMTITAFLLAHLAKVNLWDVKITAWKFLLLIAVGEVVAYLAITLGYANTSYTSVVAILSGASALPTILLAQIFFKEKMTIVQVISSLIIVAGIVLLSVG